MNAQAKGSLAGRSRPAWRLRRLVSWGVLPVALAVAVIYWMIRGEVGEPALPEVAQEALEVTEDGLREPGAEVLFDGYMVTHDSEGALRSRSRVVDGRLHGVSEGWYSDGQIETRETFVRGVSHGVRIRWHPNGQEAVRAEIREGTLDGVFQRWHENGQLAQIIHLREGEPHGLSEAYFPSGSRQARVEMENGKPIRQQFWKEGEAPVN